MARKVEVRPDVRIAQCAVDDWGVLSLDELCACGLTPDQVLIRARIGRLHRIHRGVYAVGHPALSMHARFLAAVKSVGRGALLSHFSAAALWGFVEWDERHPEVMVPRTGIQRRPGIRVHGTSLLELEDATRHGGIPVTSPARTLVDLAAVVNYRLLRRAVRQAQSLSRVSLPQLVTTVRRLGPRRGVVNLNRVLATGPAPTRSELEDVLLDLVLAAGLVPPDVNRPLLLAGRRVIPDLRWAEQRVVVEADGAVWHDNPVAREDDAERQALLEAHGERVLRVTWTRRYADRRRPLPVSRQRECPGADRSSTFLAICPVSRCSARPTVAALSARYPEPP